MTFSSLVSSLNLTFVSSMNLEGNYFVNNFKNVYAVSERFDYDSIAKSMGLVKTLDAIHETKKYNGVGFVEYKKPNQKWFDDKISLCVIFQNGLPIAISK